MFDPRYLPVTFSTLTTIALAAFDGLAVSAALPQVTADLGDVGLYSWVLTAFLLCSTIAIPIAGPIIDALGVRTTFRFTVILFVAASAACAVAPSMPVLVALRAVQGVGGGLVIAVALSAVGVAYPVHLRSRAYAANSTVWGVMSLGGPAIAAALVATLGWQAVFLVNVPLGALAAATGWNRLPERVVAERNRVRFDVPGIVLLTGFTAAAVLAAGSVSRWTVVGFVIAVAFGAAYWAWSGRAREPVLARRYLTAAPFGALNFAGFAVFAAALGLDSYVPLFVQGGLGRSAAVAAFSLAFLSVGWTSASLIVSRVFDRIPESTAIIVGFGFLIPSLVVGLVVFSAATPLTVVFAVSFLQGFGVGTITNSVLTLLQAQAAPEEIGRASSSHQYLRGLGNTVGTAAAGAVLLAVVSRRIGDVASVRALLAGEEVALAAETRDAVAAGFRLAHILALAIASLGLVAALRIRRDFAAARLAKRGGIDGFFFRAS